MKKAAILTTALMSVCSLSFSATLHSLNQEQVTKLFEDKTIAPIVLIAVNKQLVPTAFTGYLNKDGKLTGRFANKPENQPQTDQGIWEVKANGALCFTWQHWAGNKPECMNIYNVHNSIVLLNSADGTLKSVILAKDITPGNQIGSS